CSSASCRSWWCCRPPCTRHSPRWRAPWPRRRAPEPRSGSRRAGSSCPRGLRDERQERSADGDHEQQRSGGQFQAARVDTAGGVSGHAHGERGAQGREEGRWSGAGRRGRGRLDVATHPPVRLRGGRLRGRRRGDDRAPSGGHRVDGHRDARLAPRRVRRRSRAATGRGVGPGRGKNRRCEYQHQDGRCAADCESRCRGLHWGLTFLAGELRRENRTPIAVAVPTGRGLAGREPTLPAGGSICRGPREPCPWAQACSRMTPPPAVPCSCCKSCRSLLRFSDLDFASELCSWLTSPFEPSLCFTRVGSLSFVAPSCSESAFDIAFCLFHASWPPAWTPVLPPWQPHGSRRVMRLLKTSGMPACRCWMSCFVKLRLPANECADELLL